MNYGTIRKVTNTPNSNTSSISGVHSRQCEYEIHRLCQEQILKQRQRKSSSHIVSCRYLLIFSFSPLFCFFFVNKLQVN